MFVLSMPLLLAGLFFLALLESDIRKENARCAACFSPLFACYRRKVMLLILYVVYGVEPQGVFHAFQSFLCHAPAGAAHSVIFNAV